MSKICRYCQKIKPVDEFWLDKRGVYSARCKACHGLAKRICWQCGSTFEGTASHKFCSENCRREARPQTFHNCQYCGKRFGPISHLGIKFCSPECGYAYRGTVPKKPRAKRTLEAQRAQSIIARLIATGKLARPTRCEACGIEGQIEAAHADYGKPTAIRWLCIRCHRLWDRLEPKGGTMRI